MYQSDWHAQTLQSAMTEQPNLQLSFYSFGVILRKITENGGICEYPVEPDDIAHALSAKTVFTTGLLSDDVLLVQQTGIQQTVVSFRRRQRTGIWLEGSDDPLRVPLPDLVLIRTTINGQAPSFTLFAVKGRPQAWNTPLYYPPLPNVFDSGNICWGNIQMRTGALQGTSLAADWQTLFGTRFGSHAVRNKSRTYREDVRQMLLALHSNPRRRVYPPSELLSAHKTLGKVLNIEETGA